MIWSILPNFEVNGLDWQCCLAGSSKTAPRIFIFQLSWVPNVYLIWNARAFLTLSIGTVRDLWRTWMIPNWSIVWVQVIPLIIQDQFYTIQRSPTPQTSDWSGTFFFAVSYSKPALTENWMYFVEKPPKRNTRVDFIVLSKRE